MDKQAQVPSCNALITWLSSNTQVYCKETKCAAKKIAQLKARKSPNSKDIFEVVKTPIPIKHKQELNICLFEGFFLNTK